MRDKDQFDGLLKDSFSTSFPSLKTSRILIYILKPAAASDEPPPAHSNLYIRTTKLGIHEMKLCEID